MVGALFYLGIQLLLSGPGTSALKPTFLMGQSSGDTAKAQLPNAHPIGEGALPFHSWSGMAGRRGGREKSVERREGPYPGEWQLPTSGRASGEALPVVAAAAAVVVPGVFVPPVSRPWPAGGLGGPPLPLSPFAPPPAEGLRGPGSKGARGAEGAEPPFGLQVPSPWQRPRPWGRAEGGETARLRPPTVAPPRSGPGGPVPAAVEAGAEAQGTREQEGGRARCWIRVRRGYGATFPPARPGNNRPGFRGEGPHLLFSGTSLLHFSGPCVEHFGGCI